MNSPCRGALPRASARGSWPPQQATALSSARPSAHPEQRRAELRKPGSSATVVATKRPGRTFSKSPQWGDDLDFCCGRDQKSGFADLRKQGRGWRNLRQDESWDMTDTVK